ncbi:MAG: 50S ribosomal protein L19 [Simkania negevensis]|nr:50S ribosomal protein L19 [Simkania negevensis]
MSRVAVIEEIEQTQMKKDLPSFGIGDTLRVHLRIIEGEKERVQVFTGAVIAKKGAGLSETFTLYRVAYGSGMERIFLIHSPRIAKIEVIRYGRARRAKLYYLRGAFGKASKVKEKLRFGKEVEGETPSEEGTAQAEGASKE